MPEMMPVVAQAIIATLSNVRIHALNFFFNKVDLKIKTLLSSVKCVRDFLE
jgi:hypothetical protein